MSQTVADYILQRLSDWGVRRIFGFPGDGINGIMGAMGRADDRFDYVRVRHEEMAAFMAGGHAKFTGEVGVCLATSGPGAIHLPNGLYDAKMDHMPVVAIVGQQARSALGSDYQQEVDLQMLFGDVCGYVETLMVPAQARVVVDRTIRVAAAERCVTCIIVPNDLQELDAVSSPPRKHGEVYSGVGYANPRPVPTDEDLKKVAEVLKRLLPLLKPKDNPDWRERIELNVRKWWRALEAKAMEPADPINPQRIFWELSPRLPDDVILCGDCGSHTNWYARDVKMRKGMMGSLSGKLATMGSGVPYAIAAKFAHPDRPVLAIVGDGAMQMNGNAELITVKRYWKQWSTPTFVVMVLVNHDLNQVTWEQRGWLAIPSTRHPSTWRISPIRVTPKTCSASRAFAWTSRRIWARRGRTHSRPTVPSCLKSCPTPTCRRCRRTSRWHRPRRSPKR